MQTLQRLERDYVRVTPLQVACLGCMSAIAVAAWAAPSLEPGVCAALLLVFAGAAYGV